MPKISENRIVWDEEDFLTGLQIQSTSLIPLTVGGKGAIASRQVNPYRKLGAITPGYLPVDVTNVSAVTSLIVAGDADYSGSTPYAYLGGSDMLHRLNLSSDTLSNTGQWPRTFTHHATPIVDDIIVYNIVNGVTSSNSTMALYAFHDATDGDVGAYDISADVFYDSFLSTQPTGAFTLTTDPHPGILGDDGFVYFGNGNSLVQLDGTGGGNGTLTTALSFPRGTVIRSFAKRPGYLIIFTSRGNTVSTSYYRGTATAYFWNYNSSKYNFAYDLSDNYVSAGFAWNGIPGCFTYGRAAGGGVISTKLKLFNGSYFEQVLDYGSNPPAHGGVEIHDAMIVWNYSTTTSQNFIASYGSPWKGKIPNAFNYIAEVNGTTNGGICKNFVGTKLYVSAGTTTSGGLKTISANYAPLTSEGSFWEGITAVPGFGKHMIGKITAVKVHFRGSATAGRTLELTLNFNYGATTVATVFTALGTLTGTQTIKEYNKDSSNIEFPFFHSIFPRFTWTTGTDSSDAPAVYKLEIFFEQVQFNQPSI